MGWGERGREGEGGGGEILLNNGCPHLCVGHFQNMSANGVTGRLGAAVAIATTIVCG